jgi:hypothetical protein
MATISTAKPGRAFHMPSLLRSLSAECVTMAIDMDDHATLSSLE